MPAYQTLEIEPPERGSIFRILELQPKKDPYMHRTDTIDYAICMSGECVMILDNDLEIEMKAGDAIVFFHNTLHTSRTHTASAPRKSLVIRYLTDESHLTKTYCNNVPPYERQGLQVVEGGKIPEDFFPRLF